MRKIIFIHVVTIMFAAIIIQKASCQAITNSADTNIGAGQAVTWEQDSSMPVNTPNNYRNNINIKAVRNFIQNFKDARNVTWSIADDGGYVARFIRDSVQTMVAYNHKGSWNYTLKKYGENKLPADVRAMVKSNYFDYYIAEVKEFRLPQAWEKIIYRVLIKNAGGFKILKICDMEMEIIGDYTKP